MPADQRRTDLELFLLVVAESGPSAISKALGEFAFVAWNHERREIIAARDTFGTWRLHFSRRHNLFAFSTRASLLADDESYDLEFIAEYLVSGHGAAGHSAFQRVEAIQAAEIFVVKDSGCRRTRFWSAPPLESHQLSPDRQGDSTIERFRELLFGAVEHTLDQRPDVWSELSGGMDSSSIVAAASALVSTGAIRHGLAGVATYTPITGGGGDPEHAALVGRSLGIKQRSVTGWWGWKDDDDGPPLLDQPGGVATYALTRQVTRLVRDAGGRVLLSGLGADLYLRPHLDAAADRLAVGDLRGGVALLARWATATRTSFWKMTFEHGVYPCLPSTARQLFARSSWRIPAWISPAFARAFELEGRTPAVRLYEGRRGDKVRAALSEHLLTEEEYMPREMMGEDNLEWRYPYLDRRLVEYSLTLPLEWQFSHGLSKRVLREAMRGLLPEQVRLRKGKGGLHPEHHAALRREREKLMALFEGSILAQLGCVLPVKMSEAVSAYLEQKHAAAPLMLHHVLSVELWLQTRQTRRA